MPASYTKFNILHLRDSPWLDGPGRTILESASRIDSSKFGFYVGPFYNGTPDEHPLIKEMLRRNIGIFPIEDKGTFAIVYCNRTFFTCIYCLEFVLC